MYLRCYSERERSALYNTVLAQYASEAGAAIRFCFVKSFVGEPAQWDIYGRAGWEQGSFVVSVRSGMPVAREWETAAHELGHILEGHVRREDVSPTLQAIRNASYAQWVQGTASPDASKRYENIERSATARAQKILEDWRKMGFVP